MLVCSAASCVYAWLAQSVLMCIGWLEGDRDGPGPHPPPDRVYFAPTRQRAESCHLNPDVGFLIFSSLLRLFFIFLYVGTVTGCMRERQSNVSGKISM